MTKDDPFGFDLSAKTDKKRRTKGRRGMTGAFETSTRICDKAGCEEPAQYRAPKNPRNLDDYFWFCKDHVREYNQNWNYFQGQSEEEFQAFLDNATVWERPTKPFGRGVQEQAWARHGISDPMEILGANGTDRFMVFDRSAEKVDFQMPQLFEQFPAQQKGLEFVVLCHCETAGVVVYFPQSVGFGDGI